MFSAKQDKDIKQKLSSRRVSCCARPMRQQEEELRQRLERRKQYGRLASELSGNKAQEEPRSGRLPALGAEPSGSQLGYTQPIYEYMPVNLRSSCLQAQGASRRPASLVVEDGALGGVSRGIPARYPI
eukprot:scaffold176602_cov54-Prasinocladus_malaysianus.AAC.1